MKLIGRSSDLLYFELLPIRQPTDSGYAVQNLYRAYSSGSVQDLHLIPFTKKHANVGFFIIEGLPAFVDEEISAPMGISLNC